MSISPDATVPGIGASEPNAPSVDWDGITLMLYGSIDAPQGPRSALSVLLLQCIGADYRTVDVGADAAARSVAVQRSGVTTFPQLYIDGEYIGGGEVIGELMRSGFLARRAEAVDLPAVDVPAADVPAVDVA
ncbi:glutaredoxin family protein [Micromonospora aurantiaca (nom. illeg.)]|uniref:Glutaredoxin domain-containing protein n=1 Tax=Micromonospora aurantiaca (nom. illeg.) TaxID=47850 RepID=A0A6N3K043_9ACTN|nr:glutaredoxin domain-containing protein [Micromonospora aurantiaca]ADL45330.1 glutaredoxin [Micromonospora aurantiaca ATCC 27029]AXH91445.1 hypothetical protein DVH21_16765 [Micromonospora aurantiaca]